ncbi:hypothetical protein [Candidatus Nitrosotenuis cloacae]|uniref:hypothetical protein n=1 Tax=Candidatus Nitrosotenuis cloacae TaxID=1603555 RepID=UPI00227FABD5|nr:hypothetical protein [Candidatus Nitrosotenuis cloacae]
MAEASLQVYTIVEVMGILFGFILLILRKNRLVSQGLQKNFRSKQSTVYAFIAIIMFVIGFIFAYWGGAMMLFSDISLKYSISPEPDLTLTDAKDKWIVNSIHKIVEGIKAQSLESKHSEGLAFLGIGLGIALASIPILLESWKQNTEIKKTTDFLIEDLKDINSKLVTAIHLIENTLNDVRGQGNFINNLIQRRASPTTAFGTLVTGLYFLRWELYASQLREFGLTDPKIINQLHIFISEFNKDVEPDEDSIVMQVTNMLNAGNPNLFQQLQTFLAPALTDNLSRYRNLHNFLHSELDQISWIPNRTWRQA